MSDSDECEYGHMRDEHGDETGLYPNATPCQIEDCRCVCFDPIHGDEP